MCRNLLAWFSLQKKTFTARNPRASLEETAENKKNHIWSEHTHTHAPCSTSHVLVCVCRCVSGVCEICVRVCVCVCELCCKNCCSVAAIHHRRSDKTPTNMRPSMRPGHGLPYRSEMSPYMNTQAYAEFWAC